VDTETAVDSCAGETDEDAEFGGGPLGGWSAAVAATVIAGDFLDLEELVEDVNQERGKEEWKDNTLERVSGSTSHMALLAMIARFD
jgi:hypothetical protein